MLEKIRNNNYFLSVSIVLLLFSLSLICFITVWGLADFRDPRVMKITENLNIKDFEDLIKKDNLYHIGNPTYMALYAKYVKEHYNMDVVFSIIEVNPLFMVYKHMIITPDIRGKLKTIPVNVAGLTYNVLAIK